ncbi:MAG TPA: transglycosylase SLT domain-containing protein [Steroidobacteraceae bacterium]|nr:transglycosylase SLT domain-containing protein [Steroidobacteraceae bacterium]
MALRYSALAVLALGVVASWLPSPALADGQTDPEIELVVRRALADLNAKCLGEKYDYDVWNAMMEPRLKRRVPDKRERQDILRNVYCEANRREPKLPPELVLAVIDVESSFDRYAVSRVGAQGLMQVMPFWPEKLGMKRHELVRIRENVHMGCEILRYYLDREHKDVRKALARYNGSPGRRAYPDSVVNLWMSRWRN